jgi:hypothetical protein
LKRQNTGKDKIKKDSDSRFYDHYNCYNVLYNDDSYHVSRWYCGEHNHTTSVCRHGAEIVCYKCNGYGHKAKHFTVY